MSNTHHHVEFPDNSTPPHSPTSPFAQPPQVGPNNIMDDVIDRVHFSSIPSNLSYCRSLTPPQTRKSENNNHSEIEPNLYKFIVNGDMAALLLREQKWDVHSHNCTIWEHMSTMKGSNGNNVVHIAAESGQKNLLVELLLPRCSCLAKKKNSKGDLPFHSAVKAGKLGSLEALTTWDIYPSSEDIGRELLGWGNNEGDTPLHIAVDNNKLELAEHLMEKYGEACYQLNDRNVCPLYMAIQGGDSEFVAKMVSFTKKHGADSGDALLQGKSIVHAAIAAGNLAILENVRKNHENLMEVFDEDGRTPLSYAAFKGHGDVVDYLMKKFPTYDYDYDYHYDYKCDKDGSFPIHSAAKGGHTKVVLKLRSTWYFLNSKGQNILHVAAANGKYELVSYLLGEPAFNTLINSKDEDGYTPLHLASIGFHPRVVYMFTWEKRVDIGLKNKDGLTALDVAEIHAWPSPPFEARLTSMALRYVNAPRSSLSTNGRYITNNKLYTKEQNSSILKSNGKTSLEKYKDRIDTHLVVATLVATVTFAAGFTVPGGYKQSDNDPYIGMAVLAHKWAFDVFVICNTAAMYSSILSVVTLIWAQLNDLQLLYASLKIAIPLLAFSLSMMSMAFLMGMYVVLRNRLWLSYLVLSMGSVFTMVVLLIFIPLYNPSYIRNSVLRYFFSAAFVLLLLVNDKTKIHERQGIHMFD